MKNVTANRVHYFENQFLRRQDFSDEQSYQIALRRRHNITHHSWGIAMGLDIAQEEGLLVIRPGIAVDGYGREILLASKRRILVEEFQRLGSNRLDVWIFYESTPLSSPPVAGAACSDQDVGSYYRTSETPRIAFERAGGSRITKPQGVTDAALNAPVQLNTSDDPADLWGVYLGRVTFVPEETDPQKRFLIDASDRHYTDVRAEIIDHPALATRVQLGTMLSDDQRQLGDTTYTYNAKANRAFAIFVPADNIDSADVILDPRFAIDGDGTNILRGTTTVKGNIELPGGAVQFTKPATLDNSAVRSDASIYRASEVNADELRIDLGVYNESNPRRFVIGLTTEDGTFRPALTLEYLRPPSGNDPQPLVTIDGDLKLNGLVNCADLVERSLSKETLDALLSSFQAGSIAAGGQ